MPKRKLNGHCKKIIDNVMELNESIELKEKKEKKNNEELKYQKSSFFKEIGTDQKKLISIDKSAEYEFYFQNLITHKINPKVQQIKEREDYINFIY